jgi:two-component system chemotaxis response regulator CheB
MSKIKVLIVDDSAAIRVLLTQLLSEAPDIEVVGSASDPYKAREKMRVLQPDVLTLDVEMPRMDGLTFLGKIMASRPMPVIMISSYTEEGCDTTLQALELGAVDFVTKPRLDTLEGMASIGKDIIDKVRIASRARVTRQPPAPTPSQLDDTCVPSEPTTVRDDKVVAIGTSTGGTQALTQVLPLLPPDSPGIVAVIHMPSGFTKSYARRLDEMCRLQVREASDGDAIISGRVLIAPGNYHMAVRRSGARYVVAITDDAPVNQFRPSVDVLFHSCARTVGSNALGVILTGMGNDGAEGLLAMKNAGAPTIAQDEESCVVFGMPKQAIQLGGVESILPLDRIADGILSRTRRMTAGVS